MPPFATLFLILPATALIVGGLWGTLRQMSPLTQSGIQHFAAGVVFAAIAGQIIPYVIRAGYPEPALGGFIAGVLLMFGLRTLAEKLERVESPLFLGLLAAVAIDCVIDGITIGVGFAAGVRQGLLISGALAFEMLFLGLATAVTLAGGGVQRLRIVVVSSGLSFILLLAAMAGTAILPTAPPAALAGLLAFSAASLLYLVTEELMIRAHGLGETRFVTALFFVGFFAVFAVELFT